MYSFQRYASLSLCNFLAHTEPGKYHLSEAAEPSCCHQDPVQTTALSYLLATYSTVPLTTVTWLYFLTVIDIWLSSYFFAHPTLTTSWSMCIILCTNTWLFIPKQGHSAFYLTIYPLQSKYVSVLELLVVKSLLTIIDRVSVSKYFTNEGRNHTAVQLLCPIVLQIRLCENFHAWFGAITHFTLQSARHENPSASISNSSACYIQDIHLFQPCWHLLWPWLSFL